MRLWILFCSCFCVSSFAEEWRGEMNLSPAKIKIEETQKLDTLDEKRKSMGDAKLKGKKAPASVHTSVLQGEKEAIKENLETKAVLNEKTKSLDDAKLKDKKKPAFIQWLVSWRQKNTTEENPKTKELEKTFFLEDKRPKDVKSDASVHMSVLQGEKDATKENLKTETYEGGQTLDKTQDKAWSIELENSLLFEHNLLLGASDKNFVDNWSVSIPYTEFNFNASISEKLLFELELEFSYLNRSLDVALDDLFFKYSVKDSFIPVFIPLVFQWGKFKMEYIDSNSKTFHKDTLTEKTLYPYGDRALGASLEARFTHFLSLLIGLQTYRNPRETDGFYSLKPSSKLSSYLLYKSLSYKAFAGYFQQDLFLEGFLRAYGGGAEINHSYQNWLFKLKTELWEIHKTEPKSELLTYYVFPYVKWNSLIGVGWLLGSAEESLSKQVGYQFESLIKFDFYFNPNAYFSIERVREYSSIYTKNSINFSIKSYFSL